MSSTFAVPESPKYSITVRKLGRIGTPGPLVGPRRAKRGTLSDFATSLVVKYQKKLKGGPFGEKNSEKSLTMPKKLKVWTLWGIFFEKSLTMPKKLKGGLFSLSRYGVTRKKRKNLFGSVR